MDTNEAKSFFDGLGSGASDASPPPVLTTDVVTKRIKAINDPKDDDPDKDVAYVDRLQSLLNDIAVQPGEEERLKYYATVSANVRGKDYKDMVTASKSKAKEKWQKARAEDANPNECEPTPLDAPEGFPVPIYGKCYADYNGQPYVWSLPGDFKEDVSKPLHTALSITRGVTYPDRKVSGSISREGVIIEFKHASGEVRRLAFPVSSVYDRTPKGMMNILSDAGVGFGVNGANALRHGVLTGGTTNKHGYVYDIPGMKNEIDVYVAPNGQVYGNPAGLVVMLADPLPGFFCKGDPDLWRDAVAVAFAGEVFEKAPHVAAVILFAFVSPLLDRAEEATSFTLSIAGRTSLLKTTSMELAATAWGTRDPLKKGAMVTFSATDNALEKSAIRRSGCLIGIDDASLRKERATLCDLAYRLASGVERSRMNEDGLGWCLLSMFSSEAPLADLIREGGKEPPPGFFSRVIEIPVTSEDRVSDEMVDALKVAFDNHGHAGPVLVQAIFDGGYDRDTIRNAVTAFEIRLMDGADYGQQERRASRAIAFMWLAGEIAQDVGLIPADFDVAAFAKQIWSMVKDAANTKHAVAGRVFNALRNDLREGQMEIRLNKGVIPPFPGGLGVTLFTQFRKDKVPVFVIPESAFKKMIGAETPLDAARILDDDGALLRDRDRLKWGTDRSRIGTAAYVVPARLVLGDEADFYIQDLIEARQRPADPYAGLADTASEQDGDGEVRH